MASLLFGTGGAPHSSRTLSTVDGIRRIAELGLGCMEVEFVQGVRMEEGVARQVREVASREGIRLSAHGPYFINLNAHEPEKVAASQQRVLQTARVASICGAESIVFHPAYYLGDPPEKAYDNVKRNLAEVMRRLRQEDNRVTVRLEVMGKTTEFGTIEEILRLCGELKGVGICVDFAHWHARGGDNNSYPEFADTLRRIGERLGESGLASMHIHFSGIAYGRKGEIKHLNLKESDLKYVELLRALKDSGAGGLVVCESPNLEEDALILQETYARL